MSLRQRSANSGDLVSDGNVPLNDDVFTSEDLLIDDQLPAIERVCRYCSATMVLQRVVHVAMLSDVGREAGFDVMIERIVPLLPVLCNDKEWVVRKAVANEVAVICSICIALGAGRGYAQVVDNLLPLLGKLAGDSHPEVRAEGATALAGCAGLLKPEDLAAHLFTIVIGLAHADGPVSETNPSESYAGYQGTDAPIDSVSTGAEAGEDLRMAAALLMERLGPHLGQELCNQFVVPTMEHLADDESFRVRKAVALHLSGIIKSVEELVNYERLIPMWIALAEDEIWGVRRACAESIMDVSQALMDEDDRAVLYDPMCNLLEDENERWVQNAAFEQLGPFITTLPYQECLSGNPRKNRLLKHYRSMADPLKKTKDKDKGTDDFGNFALSDTEGLGGSTWGASRGGSSRGQNMFGNGGFGERKGNRDPTEDRPLWCAHAFPGVLMALGKERWQDGFLRQVYIKLAKNPNPKVRRTLAFSLHEVAKILGPDTAETSLLGFFDRFIKDVEEVSVGAIKYLASFLKNLHPPARESYLPVMAEVIESSDNHNWRVRELVASQLKQFSKVSVTLKRLPDVTPFPHGMASQILDLFPLAMYWGPHIVNFPCLNLT